MIYLKTSSDINNIKRSCAIWKTMRNEVIKNAKVGTTLIQLENICKNIATQQSATLTFHNYHGFPGYICVSVNDQLIHGIASDYALKNNDLVSFDIGVTFNEFICDAAFSVIIGDNTNEKAQNILTACNECLIEAIKNVSPNNFVGDIAHAIQTTANKHGYEVIKDFSGHGCGYKLHEGPSIPCYGERQSGVKLQPGMILCIEPMILTGSDRYYIDRKNKWTVISSNHKLTCHTEHMVLVTDSGYEILTA